MIELFITISVSTSNPTVCSPIAVIFNWCAVAQWCDVKGPQVCDWSLGQGRKEVRKKLRNKKIAEIHDHKI
jgi:hypothetical protein